MEEIKKCAILLVRVSTQDQDYEAQISDLRTSAKKFGYNKFKIIESKETGLADLNFKVGTNELFEFFESNPEYNTVIATELSRLGRRQSVLQSLKEWFIDNSVQLYIKDYGFWLLDDNGEITQHGETVFTLYCLFAESEIKTKKDRFIRERKALMEQGISISGKLLFGYERVYDKLIKKNKLAEDEGNAKIVSEIFNWYLYGFPDNNSPSIKDIAIKCIKDGYPKYTHSKRNVNKLLKEKAYTGFKVTNNKTKNPKYGLLKNAPKYVISSSKIKYPLIVNEELFDAVQKRLMDNMSKPNRNSKHITILSLLLKCPNCGRSLSANYRFSREKPSHSYRCTSRSDAIPCGNQFNGSMRLYDSTIWSVIKDDWIGLSEAIIEETPDEVITGFKNQLKNLGFKKNNILKEVNGITKTIQSLNSFSEFEMTSATSSLIGKLKKFQHEIKKIQNEEIKLENELLIIDNGNNDYNVVTDSIGTIQNDKQLLKDYTNRFINDIQFVHHTKYFTVLKILFNRFGFPFKEAKRPERKISYVLIDKRTTRNIQLYVMTDYGMFDVDYDSKVQGFVEDVTLNKIDKSKHIPYCKLELY